MPHAPAFPADPRRAYDDLRRLHPSLVTVEVAEGIPATLVIGYRAALRILSDPDHFPSDPRAWQSAAPARRPILPILEWFLIDTETSRPQHLSSRAAHTAGLNAIDLHHLRRVVESTAVVLINNFCEAGAADLLTQYAIPLTVHVINTLLGLPPDISDRMITAMAELREPAAATPPELHHQHLRGAITEVVAAKRARPAGDLISALTTHPAGLTDAEITAQIEVSYARGTEPTWNLIANTLLLMMTDQRFHGLFISGSLSTRDAIDEVLFTDPPLAGSCARFPRQPQVIDGVLLPADHPVIISSTAGNNDPELGGHRVGNRAHLAWGAGPHSCPAQSTVLLIVQEALDQLLDALPDIQLAIPADRIRWRPGAFHRAPEAVPVTFPPAPPLSIP
ncbi:cytochrome P450 [Nocardia huaxiensis]|uniref:Cytochrome P450 n=2 Tax=Nocardia huaxiensis TaxID=2755382 RepID=A0A7D6ZFW4_9NOCA|nr:cytochrome P450 [Nocardia huaxiensis]